MKGQQHKQFTMRNEQPSSPIRHWYAPLSKGFTAIGKVSDNDKKRPWFKRYEA